MRWRSVLAASLLVGIASAAPAWAENYHLEFEGAIFGVLPLGKATLDIAARPEDYAARATLESGGLLKLFDRTNLQAASGGALTPAGVDWRRYDLDHAYAKKRRVTAMRRDDAGAVATSITPNYREWGKPAATDGDKRISRDPLSSLVAMAVDVGRNGVCDGRYATFDGRFRYDLILSGGRKGRFDAGGYDGPVLKCELRYQAIAGYDTRRANERRKLPKGEVWFALAAGHDGVAPPVRALIPVGIGQAGLSLKRLQRGVVDVSPTAPAAPEAAKGG